MALTREDILDAVRRLQEDEDLLLKAARALLDVPAMGQHIVDSRNALTRPVSGARRQRLARMFSHTGIGKVSNA